MHVHVSHRNSVIYIILRDESLIQENNITFYLLNLDKKRKQDQLI